MLEKAFVFHLSIIPSTQQLFSHFRNYYFILVWHNLAKTMISSSIRKLFCMMGSNIWSKWYIINGTLYFASIWQRVESISTGLLYMNYGKIFIPFLISHVILILKLLKTFYLSGLVFEVEYMHIFYSCVSSSSSSYMCECVNSNVCRYLYCVFMKDAYDVVWLVYRRHLFETSTLWRWYWSCRLFAEHALIAHYI